MDNCGIGLHPNPATILGEKTIVFGCHLALVQHCICFKERVHEKLTITPINYGDSFDDGYKMV